MRRQLLKYYLPIVIIFLGCTTNSGAQDAAGTACVGNPLLEVIGKPFGEYHDTYREVMHPRLHGDSLSRAELVKLFEEAAMADRLEVSRYYVSHAVNNYLGKTFRTLINELRIEEAIRLMAEPNRKAVGNIAIHTGFNDRKSFLPGI